MSAFGEKYRYGNKDFQDKPVAEKLRLKHRLKKKAEASPAEMEKQEEWKAESYLSDADVY